MAIHLREASSAEDWRVARALVVEYVKFLDVDLSFQDIDAELGDLAAEYGRPDGTFYLVFDDAGTALGCVGLRRFSAEDGEMKRMFVRPTARGLGAGKLLAHAVIEAARARGYRRLLLDTLARLHEAVGLYRALGFVPIDAYRFNPVPGVIYLALELRPPGGGAGNAIES